MCLPPSLIIWLCLWLGEFARKLHGGFLCCAVSNASFKFSSIIYLLCMNMCVWYMCMVHVHVCVRDGVHSHVHAWRPEEGFGCPVLLLSALFPGDRVSHQTWHWTGHPQTSNDPLVSTPLPGIGFIDAWEATCSYLVICTWVCAYECGACGGQRNA